MDPALIPTRQLCDAARLFGERQWCLATGGNFSARIERDRFLITKSGTQKADLNAGDLMECNLDGEAIDAGDAPSAETPLHARLYSLDEGIRSVLHTHSVPATVLSRQADARLTISGYEMQKALKPVQSHEDVVTIEVFDNTQDMQALAVQVAGAWETGRLSMPGFLVRGHGLYAWGATVPEARRHLEGFEFLFACLLLGSEPKGSDPSGDGL